ncbi:hypothetical protein FRC10_010174 [Ceratobasidium sp. 414]|nr:hypothetical protein FRC10_010174 [Ceratobasidium sp. 414]
MTKEPGHSRREAGKIEGRSGPGGGPGRGHGRVQARGQAISEGDQGRASTEGQLGGCGHGEGKDK